MFSYILYSKGFIRFRFPKAILQLIFIYVMLLPQSSCKETGFD